MTCVVALQAARLDEPLGEHREIPEVEYPASGTSSSQSSASLREFGRVRRIGEVGARALAAVTDRAAEAVDGVRTVRVEIEAGGHDLAPGIDRRWRPRSRTGATGTPLAISWPSGVLVVADAVDPLVAGRAAVVARDFLEIVVDRQLGKADLLDLGRRHQVDAGEAAEEMPTTCCTSTCRRGGPPSARSRAERDRPRG